MSKTNNYSPNGILLNEQDRANHGLCPPGKPCSLSWFR
jgi:hypothetical protein